MTDRGDDNISLESSDVAASHIGTLIATPDNDEQSCAVSNEIPMTPLNKNTQDVSTSNSKQHDVFYSTNSGLSHWNAKMAKLTPSMKDHDKLDKIKLQEEIDSANATLSSNKNVEGDDNVIGENQLDTEDALSTNYEINIGSSYSKSIRRSSNKFGSRLRFFRNRTSAAVQGANLEDEELQTSQKKQESTEITDDEDEGRSSIVTGRNVIGSLLKDTYSFIYVYPVCSAPTIYAGFLFLFQSLVYALLLSSLIDVNNPNNILHVPPSVSIQMRIAQGCAILIAVVNSVDIMVAMNNLLRVPTAIIVIDDNGDESYGMINTHGPSIHNATELSSIQHGIGHTVFQSRIQVQDS